MNNSFEQYGRVEVGIISLGEAAELLNVSRAKISQLIRKGMIPFTINPLDNREKLVNRQDVLALDVRRRGGIAA